MRMTMVAILLAGLSLLAGCDKPVHEANAPIQWSAGR
jgi:hypothetical protein